MTHSTNNDTNVSAECNATAPLFKHLGKFAACMVGTTTLCLGAYFATVDNLVEKSEVPGTYKSFLLKDVPGPRIIFESGSNSHHAIDTKTVGTALGMTAINIADNAGYSLEDKVTRLETYTRAGDVVVLPLEWSFYSREKLTDAYVESIFSENRDYYRSMPPLKRLQRALSLPPETVISELRQSVSRPAKETESPAHQLFSTAITLPSGHFVREASIGPGVGVADQSCDDYILGKPDVRKTLKLGKNVKPALARLKKLKARGVDIHFAWPVLAGEGCMSDPAFVKGFRSEIETAVNKAGFEFLGTPSQSLYGQNFQDDTPYHLISAGTDLHTAQMIRFLKAQGHDTDGKPLDLKTFARHRLLELELAEATSVKQPALPVGHAIRMDDPDFRSHVHFSAGWWVFEPYGRWMRDNRAMFQVTLPDSLPVDAMLEIKGITRSRRQDRVNISIDGHLIASSLFRENAPLQIPVADLPRGKALSIFIDLPDAGVARSPLDEGESEDARSMTLLFQSLELTSLTDLKGTQLSVSKDSSIEIETVAVSPLPTPTALSEVSIPPVALKRTPYNLEIDTPKSSIEYGAGWWSQETEGRWMRNETASFDLRVPQSDQSSDGYILRLVGDFFLNKPQPVDIMINEEMVGSATVDASGIISIPFASSKVSESVKVTVNLTEANLISPKAMGLSSDERTLTYFLKSAELQPI